MEGNNSAIIISKIQVMKPQFRMASALSFLEDNSSGFTRVAIHNIELLYNAGAVVIRVAIHITYVKRIKGHFYE